MEEQVEQELNKAKGDLREAIREERKRSASTSQLSKESQDLALSMGDLQRESTAARNRIWWKASKWMLLAGILIFIIVGGFIIALISQLRKAKDAVKGAVGS